MSGPVYLATDAATAGLTEDDQVLADAFAAVGREARPVVWGERLPSGSTLVIRSTWDYIEHPDRFQRWLEELDADGVLVHNPTSVLRWNLHKGYLLDLDERGVPTVPTMLVRRGRGVALDALLREQGWDDAVVKPAIGGTARLAMHVGAVGVDAAQLHLDDLVVQEDAVVQAFVPSVRAAGELSVIVIGGEVTHAVRKRARPGEWRVQSEYGGRSELIDLDDRLASAALAATGAVRPAPTYARVDLVEDPNGQLRVIELELVEPELFFRLHPAAAARLAAELQ